MTPPASGRGHDRRAWPVLLALAVALALAGAALRAARFRTDLADLLPQADTPAARFMLRELRAGAANRLILIGIDGLPAPRLAALSRALAARLAASGAFALVRDGSTPLLGSPAARFLFAHRYLLAPGVDRAAFTRAALRRDAKAVLAGLQSAASPLVARYGLRDPTRAGLALARAWSGGSRIRARDGVWMVARPGGGPRALILAETRAGGIDLHAGNRAVARIRADFAALAPPGAQLALGGTAVLSDAAERVVRADVTRISVLSALAVTLLLVWRFRSPVAIAAILVPLALGVAVATALAQAWAGSVQGMAFGFGMTMLGVSVDYPVLFIGHRKAGETPAATFRRIGQAFALAVLAALLGLSGMLAAPLPAIAALGGIALTGLAVAALATWLVLPPLVVAAGLAPVGFGDTAILGRVEGWRRFRRLGLAVVAGCGLFLAVSGGPRWATDLAALSPVPRPVLAEDAALRAAVGVPDAGQLGLVRGNSAEAVLVAEERLAPVLAKLRAAGALASVTDAAQLLPSLATQRARQAALPPAAVLARRMAAATAGLGFRAGAFAPFLADVAAARLAAPITPQRLRDPVLAARLAPLLLRRGRHWYGLIAPSGVTHPHRVAAALRAHGALYVDVAAESARLVTRATVASLHLLAWGGLAALAVLLVGLRDPWRVARVAGAVLAALVVAVATLTLLGVRVSLLQVVALQLAAGVGIDYALFFARAQADAEERARTLRTLITCNAMTLMTFGLLATARTPLLRQIGLTVVIGAAAAMIAGFLFAGPRRAEPEPGDRSA